MPDKIGARELTKRFSHSANNFRGDSVRTKTKLLEGGVGVAIGHMITDALISDQSISSDLDQEIVSPLVSLKGENP